jgi:hypothetical protein
LFQVTGLAAVLALMIKTGAARTMFHRFGSAMSLHMAEQWWVSCCVGMITAYIVMVTKVFT